MTLEILLYKILDYTFALLKTLLTIIYIIFKILQYIKFQYYNVYINPNMKKKKFFDNEIKLQEK